jgi:hypothetical protein
VRIAASPTQVNEGGNASYIISSSKTVSQPLVVKYSMSGTASQTSDYTLNPAGGQATIPAGSSSTTITLHAQVDHVSERKESAIMTLVKAPGYTILSTKKSATIGINNVR